MLRPIQQILELSGEQPLGLKLAQLTVLNQLVKACLSPELAPFCQVANFREGCLILAVANGSVATRIRYQLPQLLTELRQQPGLAGLRSIRHFVQPPVGPLTSEQTTSKNINNINTSNKPQLSTQAAQTLLQLAEDVGNADLQAALKRLAKHAIVKPS